MSQKQALTKSEELKQWKVRLEELAGLVKEQIDWLENGSVVPTVKKDCPKELASVAKTLVEIQLQNGEYKREKISTSDCEKIKYYAKKYHTSFEKTVAEAVENERYLSKDRIEARGVMFFVGEVQRVLDGYYAKTGVFPVNAMSAESKRYCRNFENEVSLEEKIKTILEVYFKEIDSEKIKIVSYDAGARKPSYQLTEFDIKNLKNYFLKMADGKKIDNCFFEENRAEFVACCRLIEKAGLTLDEFLKTYTDLSYTKCYGADAVPTVRLMVKNYDLNHKSTRGINDKDPYLKNKIETAQRIEKKYTSKDLFDYWEIINDCLDYKNSVVSLAELNERSEIVLTSLARLYKDGKIDKDFIKNHEKLYEEIKFISRRKKCSIDEYLNKNGFVRESFHNVSNENVIYLSERDFKNYKIDATNQEVINLCGIEQLDPKDYFGVYVKLVANKKDSSVVFDKKPKTAIYE